VLFRWPPSEWPAPQRLAFEGKEDLYQLSPPAAPRGVVALTLEAGGAPAERGWVVPGLWPGGARPSTASRSWPRLLETTRRRRAALRHPPGAGRMPWHNDTCCWASADALPYGPAIGDGVINPDFSATDVVIVSLGLPTTWSTPAGQERSDQPPVRDARAWRRPGAARCSLVKRALWFGLMPASATDLLSCPRPQCVVRRHGQARLLAGPDPNRCRTRVARCRWPPAREFSWPFRRLSGPPLQADSAAQDEGRLPLAGRLLAFAISPGLRQLWRQRHGGHHSIEPAPPPFQISKRHPLVNGKKKKPFWGAGCGGRGPVARSTDGLAELATGLATCRWLPDSFLSMLLRLASSSDAAQSLQQEPLSVGTLTGGIPLPKRKTASTTTSAYRWLDGRLDPCTASAGGP